MAETAKKKKRKLVEFPVKPTESHFVLTETDIRQIIQDTVAASKKRPHKKGTSGMFTKDGRRKPSPANPIRSKEDFQKIVDYLGDETKHEFALRDKTLFILGCSVGLRCGDLLQLKTSDVYYDNAHVRIHIELFEQKTGKRNMCKIPKMASDALSEYYRNTHFPIDNKTYLFQSKKGGPLLVRSVSNMLKNAGRKCNFDYELSTHTMRKTYAMAALNSANNAAESADIMNMLQTKFNHSDQKITMRYIRMSQDKVDEMSDRVSEWLED